MAPVDTHDVVNSTSTGESSSVDTHANPVSSLSANSGSAPESKSTTSSTEPVRNGAQAVPPAPSRDENGGPTDAAGLDIAVTGTGEDSADNLNTDTGRVDGTDQSKEGPPKSIAAKKPTSFKSVSVTKTFLAKSVSAPSAVKTGDKGHVSAGAGQPSAVKPRLIAKSGVSTLRDGPRLKSATDGATETTGGVWNKNRPAPAPPTKQFTDEELKQQYGIHLAERLRSDGNQNKWADLDEEDEDWAPETVEWMDGTKSTIVPSDNLSPATAKATLAATTVDAARPATKPTLTALKRPVINGPLKTILRPGAAQQAKQLGTSRSNTPVSAATSATGSSAPAPTKSPWATLPPVEKFVTVYSPPTEHAQPNRPDDSRRDAHGSDALPPAPAREIEAESFDRSWREGERPPMRELFNSHSGRYEPAPQTRRSVTRADARPTSLLYRGSNAGASVQVDGGAERRSSTATAKTPQDARVGIVIGHDLGPQAQNPPSDHAQLAQQAVEDRQKEYERQQKLMREKREEAIARRQEQARQEEAAKQERIRLKMQSLPPLEKPTRKEPESAISLAPTTGDLIEPMTATRETLLRQRQNEKDTQVDKTTPSIPPASTARTGEAVRSATSPQGNKTIPQSTDPRPQAAFKSPALNAESFSTWGTPNSNKPAANVSSVWAPGSLTTGGRRIGNGAFDNSFSRMAPHLQQHAQQQDASAAGQRQRALSQDLRQPDTSPMMHQQILSDQFVTSLGLNDESMDDRLAAAGRLPGSAPGIPRAHGQQYQDRAYQPAPIAPPNRTVSGQDGAPTRAGGSVWSQFAAQGQPRADVDASVQQQNPQRWKETFKQTRVQGEWLGGPREVISTENSIRDAQKTASSVGQNASGGLSGPLAASQTGQEGTVRLPSGPSSAVRQGSHNYGAVRPPAGPPAPLPQQSRFFPTAPYGASPPPEESEHPVYAGSSGQPHVHLPSPRANVRLPPASGARAVSSQPYVAPSDWQARFNGLLGRTVSAATAPLSPPKTPPEAGLVRAAPPSSISRPELHDVHGVKSTTVSLPRSSHSSAVTSQEDLTTKSPVEALFDGELSFGSTPRVYVPLQMVYAGRAPIAKSGKYLQASRLVEAQTKSLSTMLQDVGKGPVSFVVSFSFANRPSKELVQAKKVNRPSHERTKKVHHSRRGKGDSETPKGSPTGSPAGKRGHGGKWSAPKSNEVDEGRTPNGKKEPGQLKLGKTRPSRVARVQQSTATAA